MSRLIDLFRQADELRSDDYEAAKAYAISVTNNATVKHIPTPEFPYTVVVLMRDTNPWRWTNAHSFAYRLMRNSGYKLHPEDALRIAHTLDSRVREARKASAAA